MLFDLNFFKNRPVAPEILTEQGIQKVLKCDLSLVSRILHKLEKQEYINWTLLKVENKKRKQKVPFLIEKGLEYASELKKNANKYHFKIIIDNYTQKKILEYC